MGEPVNGASPGTAETIDPPTGILGPADLAATPPSKEPNSNVTGKMYQQHLSLSSSSSSSDEDEEEEVHYYDKKEEEEKNDEEGDAEERGWLRESDMYKYRGCSWLEVVGLKANKAKRIIGKGKPDIYFEVVSERQLLTMCYCSRRVRLIVDTSNCVVQTPDVG